MVQFSKSPISSRSKMARISLLLLLYLCYSSPVSGAIGRHQSSNLQQRSPTSTVFRHLNSKCDYNGVNVKPGEYYQLPNNVEPKRYRLRMRIDNKASKIFGHSSVSVYIHNKTEFIEFNSVGLNINAASFKARTVTVDAKMIYNCPEKETAVIWFPKSLHRGSGNLTLSFSGNLTELIQSGVIQGEQDSQYIYSDLGTTDARKKFPSWDEPRFKAPFDLYLIVPKKYVALSNMEVVRRRNYSDQLDEVRFQPTPPISPYQLATVFGPKFHSAKLNSKNSTVAIQILSTSFRASESWQTALEMAEKMVHFYEYYFNQSYPLKKLDLLAIKDFVPSSTEKLGILFFDEKELIIANKTLATEEELNKLAKILAHSIAHQWLGNIVAYREWKEFWVFEALASFMEHEALDSLFPQWKTWETFRGNEFRKSLRYDSSSRAKPLARMIENPTDLQLVYSNAICFQKGVSLFRMLKSSVGKERFRHGLQNFIKAHKNKTGSLAQLQAVFARTVDQLSERKVEKNYYNKVLTTIFHWTKTPGYPVIEIDEKQNGADRQIFMKQERFMDKSTENSTNKKRVDELWSIPIGFVNTYNPFTVTSKAIFEHKKIKIVLRNIFEDEWVKLNPEASNYYRVKYSQSMLEKFEVSIEEKSLFPMDRLNILDDIFALVERGDYSTEVGLQMLEHYVNEDNPNVWEAIQTSLEDLDILISNMNDAVLEKKYYLFANEMLAKNFYKLGWTANSSELSVGYKMRIDEFSNQKVREKVLCLSGRFKSPVFVKEAPTKFNEYINGTSDLSIGALECVFRSTGLFANKTKLDKFFKFYRDYSLEEARHLFSLAIGSSTEKKDLKTVLKFVMEPLVRPENAQTILQTIALKSLDLRREILRDVTSRFYTYAKKMENSNAFYNFLKSFIETFGSTSELKQIKSLLAKDVHLRPLNKSLQFSFDRVLSLENWAKRDQKTIDSFLSSYYNTRSMAATTTTLSPNDDFNNIDNEFFTFDDSWDKK